MQGKAISRGYSSLSYHQSVNDTSGVFLLDTKKRATKSYIRNPLIIFVEHIGIEPMTS